MTKISIDIKPIYQEKKEYLKPHKLDIKLSKIEMVNEKRKLSFGHLWDMVEIKNGFIYLNGKIIGQYAGEAE